MPIKIPFVAEVRDFLRGSGNVEDALDDVADSLDGLARDAKHSSDESARALDDLGDDAKDAGRDVERAGRESEDALEGISDKARDAGRDLERAGRESEDALEGIGDKAKDAGRDLERRLTEAAEEAAREAEDMGQEFKSALDDVSAKSRKAGDDLDRNTRRGFDGGSEAVGEFKDEATQNFSEVASSFTGDMDSAVDLVQGTLGGLASSIPGGVGLALAGLGASAGAFYTMWKENAEKTEERIQSMYEDMAASGREFLSAEFINQGISDILNDAEDAAIDYATAQEVAAASGAELGTVLRAYAGDAEAAAEVNAGLTGAIDEADAAFRDAAEGGNAFGQAVASDGPRLRDYRDSLLGVSEATDTAGDRAAAFRDAQVTSTEATRDYTEALAEMDDAARDAGEQIAENNDTISNQRQRTIENNAALSELAGNYLDVQDSARSAGASTDELNQLQQTQYARFMDTAHSAGLLTSEARDLARRLGLIPDNVRTDINVTDNGTTSDVQRAIDGIDGRTITMRTAVSAWQLQLEADAAARRIRPPVIQYVGRIGTRIV